MPRSLLPLCLLLVACTTTTSRVMEPPKIAPAPSIVEADDPVFFVPLDRAEERVTKKPFGIRIDPATSPVQPEKFSGYHSGTDFEVSAEEEDVDVFVRSICTGTVEIKGWIKGYGGVLIMDCAYHGEPVTVLYGHLNISSVTLPIGSQIAAGDIVGLLGKGYSEETDGERKHLHLSVHKGSSIEYKGYVSREEDLSLWINPEEDMSSWVDPADFF